MSAGGEQTASYVLELAGQGELRDIRPVCDEIRKLGHVIANMDAADERLLDVGARLDALFSLAGSDTACFEHAFTDDEIVQLKGSARMVDITRKGYESCKRLASSTEGEMLVDDRIACLIMASVSFFMLMDSSSGRELYGPSTAQAFLGYDIASDERMALAVRNTEAAASFIALPAEEACDIISSRDERFLQYGREVATQALLRLYPSDRSFPTRIISIV